MCDKMKKTKMLKKNYEFKKVLSKGNFFIEKNIQICVLKNDLNFNLLGIAIGKKNGKSFLRNRAKRLIRESYKNIENQMLTGYSIIIMIKKGTDLKNINFHDVFEQIMRCFFKANILKEVNDL